MGIALEVEVLPKAGHRHRSEAQLRKGDRPWGGSAERSCGLTYRNRIRGGTERGELASEEQPRESRHRRDDDGGTARLPTGELAASSRGTPRGDVPALAGKTSTASQGWRRSARAWHPDGTRPFHAAGAVTGPAASIRPDLL